MNNCTARIIYIVSPSFCRLSAVERMFDLEMKVWKVHKGICFQARSVWMNKDLPRLCLTCFMCYLYIFALIQYMLCVLFPFLCPIYLKLCLSSILITFSCVWPLSWAAAAAVVTNSQSRKCIFAPKFSLSAIWHTSDASFAKCFWFEFHLFLKGWKSFICWPPSWWVSPESEAGRQSWRGGWWSPSMMMMMINDDDDDHWWWR